MTVEALALALRQAEAAHAEYEKEVLRGNHDAYWPEWYARYIVKQIGEKP